MILNSNKDKDYWIGLLDKFPNTLQDIYYHPEYLNLNCLKKDSEGYMFVNQHQNKIWAYPFIKIKVPNFDLNFDKKNYYDLETAYGYGGPISNSEDLQFIKRSNTEFLNYIEKNNILVEFYRFHPLFQNSNLVDESIEIIKNRKTCSIKFDQIDDQISYYSSKVRNMINRTKKNNIHSYISLDKIDFLDFQKIYLDLMLTKKADKELFFTDSYFNQLYKLIQKNGFLSVVKNNKSEILGAGVFLFGKKFCHYHLSATNQKYKSPGVNNLLIHQAIIEAKKKKLELLHLGGGNTNVDDDNLYLFKKSMANLEHVYHVGKRINNLEFYEKVKTAWVTKKNNKNHKNFSRLLCYHS